MSGFYTILKSPNKAANPIKIPKQIIVGLKMYLKELT